MLYLYLIVTVMGTPAMTMRWGSEEKASCDPAAEVMSRDIDAQFADPKKLARLREQWPSIQRADIKAYCDFFPEKPKLENPVPLR